MLIPKRVRELLAGAALAAAVLVFSAIWLAPAWAGMVIVIPELGEGSTSAAGGSVSAPANNGLGAIQGGVFGFRFDSFFTGGSGGAQGSNSGALGTADAGTRPAFRGIQLATTDPRQATLLAQTPLPAEVRIGEGILGPATLWINGAVAFLDSDREFDVFDGRLAAVIPGIDVSPWPGVLLGMAFPYEFGDFGIRRNVTERTFSGIGLMPYVAWRVAPPVLLTLRGGASTFTNNVGVNGGGARGEFDSLTATIDGSGSYYYTWNPVVLIGRVGYRQIHDTTTGFTLSDGTSVGDDQNDIGQGRIEVTVRYPMDWITPFVEGRIEHEFMSPGKPIFDNAVATDDRTGGTIGAGVSLTISPRLVAGLRFSSAVGRQDLERYTFQGELRLLF